MTESTMRRRNRATTGSPQVRNKPIFFRASEEMYSQIKKVCETEQIAMSVFFEDVVSTALESRGVPVTKKS